jgi:hypothetical protein
VTTTPVLSRWWRLVVGMFVRLVIPSVADRMALPIKLIGKVLMPAAVLALLAGT